MLAVCLAWFLSVTSFVQSRYGLCVLLDYRVHKNCPGPLPW